MKPPMIVWDVIRRVKHAGNTSWKARWEVFCNSRSTPSPNPGPQGGPSLGVQLARGTYGEPQSAISL